MANRLRLGVLVSGRGSNLEAIIKSIEEGMLAAEISVVISDKKDALALEKAGKHNIPAVFVNPKEYKDRTAFDLAIVSLLMDYKVDLLIFAGFMRIVTSNLIDPYRGRIMNIHPALLPAFPGVDGQKQALEYGVKIAGCTVHFVEEGMDQGPIIIQAVVPVLENDNEKSLSERILKQEHKIYPMAIRLFIEGKLKIEGRRVIIKDSSSNPTLTLINPEEV